MDINTESIEDIEAILRQQSDKRAPSLYTDKSNAETTEKRPKVKLNPYNIMLSVAEQIKAMQNAECGRSDKKRTLNIYQSKKTSFMSVSMLQEENKAPQPEAQKFETQLFMDTQLLALVQNAEAQDTHTGVTQEFEMPFCQGHSDNKGLTTDHRDSNFIKNNNTFTVLDITLKEPHPEKTLIHTISSPKEMADRSSELAKMETQLDNCTQILNECIEIENVDQLDILINDTQQQCSQTDKPLSPVFSVKSKKTKCNSPDPLVFNLETFEKFEEIAIPVIEMAPEKQKAKQLINSQLVCRELFIQTDTEPFFNDNDEISPIFEYNENVLKLDKNAVPVIDKDNYLLKTSKANVNEAEQGIRTEFIETKSRGSTNSDNSLLKDEILFSSDEENEYLHKSYKDLPFTCALETSFYDQSEVLDKTMYVAFQTASNKSIQIETDSFCKAKSLFESIDEDVLKEASITKLVELCDNNVDRADGDINILDENISKILKDNELIENNIEKPNRTSYLTNFSTVTENSDDCPTSPKHNSDNKEECSNESRKETHYASPQIELLEVAKFEGIKTASDKPIIISETGLAKSKTIFQDIETKELFENLSHLNKEENSENKIHTSCDSEVPQQSPQSLEQQIISDVQPIDEELLQEFQDETMQTEFHSTNLKVVLEDKKLKSEKELLLEEGDKYFESKFVDLKSAKNKDVHISDESYTKSNAIRDINYTEKQITEHEATERSRKSEKKYKVKIFGFVTASNKKIEISDSSLNKIRSVFHNIDLSNNCDYDDGATENDNDQQFKCTTDFGQPSTSDGFLGIQTVSKKVHSKVRDDKSKNINNITQDNDKVETNYDKNFEHEVKLIELEKDRMFEEHSNKDGDSELPLYGFDQTDINKVLVEEVLAKSQSIIEKFEFDQNLVVPSKNVTSADKLDTEIQAFTSFCTTSKKEVKISDKSQERSRQLFQDFRENECVERNTDIATRRQFEDFLTASNEKVKISEKSLKTSENIFLDIDGNNCMDVVDNVALFKGFETASNEEVKISNSVLEKGRKIIQDLSGERFIQLEERVTNINQSSNNTDEIFKGFVKASNKPIKISAKALSKSREIFQNLGDNKSTEIKTNQRNVNRAAKFTGFQTTSNKQVTVSDIALEKSKKIFRDIEETECKNMNSSNTDDGAKFKGFLTANNKRVKISEEAIAKSRKLFQDLQEDQLLGTNTKNTGLSPKFTGFSTTSNKKVKISEEALARSRKLFQDLEDQSLDKNSHNLDTEAKFTGFSTASNKKVTISEDALAKSRKFFEDIQEDQCLQTNKNNIAVGSKFTGFSTASNKKVAISEDALAKSRKLFQDLQEDELSETNAKNIDAGTKFTGFSSASNKKVTISDYALRRSRKLFQDLENQSLDINSHNLNTEAKLTGFSTASNKKVAISEDALARSRKLFHDLEGNQSTHVTAKTADVGKIFKGFSTANNKKVAISEGALARSRKVFEDIEGTTQTNTGIMNKVRTTVGSNEKGKVKIGFNRAADRNAEIKQAFLKSKKIFEENKNLDLIKNSRKQKSEVKHQVEMSKDNVEFEINTEILNDFETTFKESTPKKSKRSGSPILSCPKSKKRKVFKIPYSQKAKRTVPENTEFKPPDKKETPGKVFEFLTNYKKTKVYNLRDLQKLEGTSNLEGIVDPYLQRFDFDNVLSFKFVGERNDVTDSTLTIIELKKLFLDSVNKKLIPDGWLDIHLKLIIWKLISYELKFPKTMHLSCTSKNVMQQLKYRYDKELYNAERPALRKIMEKDDTSLRTLILCVVAVCEAQDSSSFPELILTDGWYTIRAIIDKMLTEYVNNGKIKVGTKLVTLGAELVGSEQAVSPWEDTSSIRLKLFGNSTRRARWDARLGCHGNGAMLSRLSSVTLDGGKVPRLRVYVARVYPPLYVDKFEDGSTVTRSERLEHLHQMKYESERQILLEKIYEEVEKEIDDQQSQSSESSLEVGHKRKCLDSGSQIAKMMKKSADPLEFRCHLTSSQAERLDDHNAKSREKLLDAIQARVQDKMAAYGLNFNRNVVTLLKVRVVGIEEGRSGVKVARAMLSIWRPNDAVRDIITEGSWIDILNVVPTAFRYSELQLSAGRQSIFSQSRHKETEKQKPYIVSLKRTCYPIKDLVKNPAMTTEYNEIDTVGIVFQIDPSTKDFDSTKQFQNVYLTDIDKNIISVNFWGGLKKFGFENVLDTGQIVAGINLQKRAGNTRKTVPQYRATEQSYFTKTPRNDTARKVIEELSQALVKIDKNKFYQDCISAKDNYTKKNPMIENVTPYRFPNFDFNSSKNKIFLDSPLPQKINKIDENLNLTGLDFESSFCQQETQELSPKTLLRKKQVKERIAKLKLYGEPPALSPIQMINKSKNATKAYKSPLISKSGVSPSVASESENLPIQKEISTNMEESEIQCSPVICLNRTYVKKCEAKPVKLNFSKNESSLVEVTDDFADEFDCSPPLSLD